MTMQQFSGLCDNSQYDTIPAALRVPGGKDTHALFVLLLLKELLEEEDGMTAAAVDRVPMIDLA